MDHKSIWLLTETSARARLDACSAVHPPANRVRPAHTDRPILRPTRPHAQCGKPITQENKLPARWHDRPSTRVRPRFECKRRKSDSTSNAAPATPQEKLKEATPPDRTPRRAIRHPQEPQQTNPRENAAKYSAPCFSSRTILPHPSRPNAMLSRRRTCGWTCDSLRRRSA